MKNIYDNYTKFNLWANRRMAQTFSALSEDQMDAHIVSSFPSVKMTFLHIWDAEFLWLKRLQGDSPDAFPSKTFHGDSKAVFDTVLKTSQEFADFVNAQPLHYWEKTISFKTISYGAGTQQAYEMVHHCMNHSTFHRGQLITMGRQLGIEKFPPTDYVYYLREAGG
jgi:uncharacterized damage-inducible protein DinB